MFRCAALVSRGAGLYTGRYAARLRGNGSRGYDQVSTIRRQRQILYRINAIPSPSTAAAAAASGAAAGGSTAAAAAAVTAAGLRRCLHTARKSSNKTVLDPKLAALVLRALPTLVSASARLLGDGRAFRGKDPAQLFKVWCGIVGGSIVVFGVIALDQGFSNSMDVMLSDPRYVTSPPCRAFRNNG